MDIGLWVAKALLAVAFTISGVCKGTLPKERLIEMGQTGVVFFPLWAIRAIAACEVAAAFALIVPGLTGRAETLTIAAAVGLCALMVGAAVTHAKLREPQNIAINAALFGLAAFVAIYTSTQD